MRFYSIGSILVFFFLSSISLSLKISKEIEDTNKFFVSEIFNKYGTNNSITFEGFEHLLENLGLGKLKFDTIHDVSIHKINGTFKEVHDELLLHKHNHNSSISETTEDDNYRRKRNLKENQTAHFNKEVVKKLKRKCLTAQDILITFGLHPNHDTIISPVKYLQMCPAIVYELDQKLCQKSDSQKALHKQEYYLVWIYATVSIFIMGVLGLLCALLLPAIKKNHYSFFQQFLVSLAVGTLCGDAFVHLLPPVFSADENQSTNLTQIWRGTIVVSAIFIFFTLEIFLNGIRSHSEESKTVEPAVEFDCMVPKTNNEISKHQHSHNDSVKTIAWIVILGDILHNVADGLSIGAAFTSNLTSGFASSIAIFCHELPHELGDYAILLASGMSIKKSLFYNFLSSVFSFFGMAAGILLGEMKNGALWINAFTAGSFLYIALSDLVPELKVMVARSSFKNLITQIIGLFFGVFLMLTIALYEDNIEIML